MVVNRLNKGESPKSLFLFYKKKEQFFFNLKIMMKSSLEKGRGKYFQGISLS